MPTVAELIKQAEGYVEDAGLEDEELREPAFRETLRHLFGESPIEGERVPFHRSLVPVSEDSGGTDDDPPTEIVGKGIEHHR